MLAFSWEFFSGGGGKICCYANFYCYSIVFRPNFREGQTFSRREGAPPAPCERKSEWNAVYTREQGPFYCGGRERILNLISIFSLHFDIRLSDFVILAYSRKRRLTIGNSRIDLRLIQRDLLFRIPSETLKRI